MDGKPLPHIGQPGRRRVASVEYLASVACIVVQIDDHYRDPAKPGNALVNPRQLGLVERPQCDRL